MKIEAVDFFYLSMPQVTTEADGSQDALVVRVAGGGQVGWGECEASPLVSIAASVTALSHGGCRPVSPAATGGAGGAGMPGRVPGFAARLDRSLRNAHVPRRLPPRVGFRARANPGRPRR